MPLTLILDLALNETAGRKGGDESDPTKDHRVTSKPYKSVTSSITELGAGAGYVSHASLQGLVWARRSRNQGPLAKPGRERLPVSHAPAQM